MLENSSLVSVIALCYNHEAFILESLQSVVSQNYSQIELIIVDDFSNDESRKIILDFSCKNTSVKYIFNDFNIGNCRSFNKALHIANGKYIIDLSTDDVMLPNRISEQVKLFESSEKIGLVFSDLMYIDEKSQILKKAKHNFFRKRVSQYPSGNVYKELLSKQLYINPPTMMVRKTILDQLNGYDESLSYEDFDLWIRAARITEFAYSPQVLMKQRIFKGSLSTKFVEKKNVLIPSTFKVCQKALLLNETEDENLALIIRLRFLLKQCFFTEHFELAGEIWKMLKKIKGEDWQSRFYLFLTSKQIKVNNLYLNYISLLKYIQFRL